MSNNCLVTKLKGEVQNDNLPRLGIASFDMKKTGDTVVFQIASPTAAVHVKSKVLFTPYGTSTKVYEYTTNPGTSIYGTIADSDIPGNVGDIITDAIEADNMYSLNLMYLYLGKQCAMTERNNLKSTYKYAPIEIASVAYDDPYIELNDACYYLNIINKGGAFLYHIKKEDYLDSNSLEVIRVTGLNGFRFDNDHSNNTTLKHLYSLISGSIMHLPLNIEYFGNTGGRGEIVDWVEQMRSKGRTSGFCTIYGNDYGLITYNGTPLKTLFDNNTIHNFANDDRKGILVWDANTISWATEVPEGAITSPISPSAYYIQKHSA